MAARKLWGASAAAESLLHFYINPSNCIVVINLVVVVLLVLCIQQNMQINLRTRSKCMWRVRVINRLIYMCMAYNNTNATTLHTTTLHNTYKPNPLLQQNYASCLAFPQIRAAAERKRTIFYFTFLFLFLFLYFFNKFVATISYTAAFQSLSQHECWEHYCRLSYQSCY